MDAINTLLLLGGLLLFLSVLATSLARYGFPLLLIFLVMGMLAGEDGPGGIQFDDFGAAFFIGNLALAVILLDGGLRTRLRSFRVALGPALSLSTLGVLLSAALVGAFISWILGVDWRYGLLLGGIVGSTDAAAVFAQLRHGGVSLNERVTSTLEIESGTNDPMAIFLVLFLLESQTDGAPFTITNLVAEIGLQFGVGAIGGIALGYGLSFLVERLRLVEGLYALLIVSGGLIAFAAINLLGGSGFLGIYLLGLVVGNRPNHATEHVFRVMDGLAWLAQAGMFLMLGLLVTPSALWDNALPALLIALFLMLVARPLAVGATLIPFHFPWREKVFIAWVGLRGAVPIVLSMFPLMTDLSGGKFLFEITFAVVLVSLVLQGTTVSLGARLLSLRVPQRPAPLDEVELDAGAKRRFVLSQFRVQPGSSLDSAGGEALAAFEQVRCIAVARGHRMLYPGQRFRFEAGDRLFLIGPGRHTAELARLFRNQSDERDPVNPRRFYGDFILRGDARMTDLAAAYGLSLEANEAGMDLDTYVRSRLESKPVEGDTVHVGPLRLRIRSLDQGRVASIGLRFRDARRLRRPRRGTQPT